MSTVEIEKQQTIFFNTEHGCRYILLRFVQNPSGKSLQEIKVAAPAVIFLSRIELFFCSKTTESLFLERN